MFEKCCTIQISFVTLFKGQKDRLGFLTNNTMKEETATKVKSKRGGARIGSGPKPFPPEKKTKTYRIPNEVATYLKTHLVKCKNAAVTDWLKKL
jgi:hypothetical protein